MMDVTATVPSVDSLKGYATQQKLAAYARGAHNDRAAIEDAAKEFEAMFLSQMMEHMMKPIQLPEPFGGGHAEEMFHSLLVDAYAKEVAKAGGIGVAKHITKELLSLQETAQ